MTTNVQLYFLLQYATFFPQEHTSNVAGTPPHMAVIPSDSSFRASILADDIILEETTDLATAIGLLFTTYYAFDITFPSQMLSFLGLLCNIFFEKDCNYKMTCAAHQFLATYSEMFNV